MSRTSQIALCTAVNAQNARSPRIAAAMIPEHEIIEQLMDEPEGRPAAQLLGAFAPRSLEEVTWILEGLWRAGKVALASPAGALLADWESAELFRAEVLPGSVHVLATERGITSVFPAD